jgi:large subunit ribosomal protein L25
MKFVAFERAKHGTGASRRLRITGRTPGIVYGGEKDPLLIELDQNALWYALKKEAFHASVLDMEIDKQETKVLLRDVQYHPYKPMVMHVDFQRVDAKTKMHMKVPLHYSGQENSPAVKVDSCLVNLLIMELEVTCLPSDLPEFIAVDLSELKKGMPLHLNDIKLPAGVTPVTHGKTNPVIVSVVATVAEVEAPADAVAAAGKKPEGKKPEAKKDAKK